MNSSGNYENEFEESSSLSMVNFGNKIQNDDTTSKNMQNIKKGFYHNKEIENEETKMTLNELSQHTINQVFNISKIGNQEKKEEQINDNNCYFIKDKESESIKGEKASKKMKARLKKHRKQKIFLIKIEKSKKRFICKKIIKEKDAMKKNKKTNEPSRQDNVRQRFVRIILNTYYYKKICKKLKNFPIKKLKKFPPLLIFKLSKIDNKNYMEKTIRDFYEDTELNSKNNVMFKNYDYNLNIINELDGDKYKEFKEKSGLEKLLKIKFKDLIEEYQNSNDYEHKKNEIRKKKEKHEAEKIIQFYDNFIENSK